MNYFTSKFKHVPISHHLLPYLHHCFQQRPKLRASADMADATVRFGIIGCAEIARKVARAIALAPNATLSAIGSRTLEKASKFASDNGFTPRVKIYGSYEAVLDDPEVDAVYVPLPTSLHLRWAVLAAEKKKHLLLEKPVALNVAELDKILEACESNGVQFMDGTMWMHNPRTAKMKEFLSDADQFGQLKSVCESISIYSVVIHLVESMTECARAGNSKYPKCNLNNLVSYSRSFNILC